MILVFLEHFLDYGECAGAMKCFENAVEMTLQQELEEPLQKMSDCTSLRDKTIGTRKNSCPAFVQIPRYRCIFLKGRFFSLPNRNSDFSAKWHF